MKGVSRNHYATLGVAPTASQEEIRDQFRFLSQAFHPDKFLQPGDRRVAEEEFKQINLAHEVLSDPGRRERFHTLVWESRFMEECAPVDPSQAGSTNRTKVQADFYACLRLSPKATSKEVARQQQFIIKAFQLERFGSADHQRRAEAELLRIEESCKVLCDPEQRATYDASRPRPRLVPKLQPQVMDYGFVGGRGPAAMGTNEVSSCFMGCGGCVMAIFLGPLLLVLVGELLASGTWWGSTIVVLIGLGVVGGLLYKADWGPRPRKKPRKDCREEPN